MNIQNYPIIFKIIQNYSKYPVIPKKLTIHQRNIQNYQNKYPKMPKNSTFYLKMTENIQSYQKIFLKSVEKCPKKSKIYPKIQKNIQNYQKISKQVEKYQQIT